MWEEDAQPTEVCPGNEGGSETSMSSELHCTEYMMYDADDPNWMPCQCPVCKGFLKWNPEGMICKKCGTELLVIPDLDKETGEELELGKVCPISLPRR